MKNEAPAARLAGHAWFTREAAQGSSADSQASGGGLAGVSAAESGTALPLPKVGGTPRQRLYVALRLGATVNAAAAMAGVSVPLAEVMIDEMRRQGLLERAESLCASGLGACGGGTSDEVKIHCAGCPIL